MLYFVSFTAKYDYRTSHLKFSLQWRHNGRNSVSNHQLHDCLLNRLFRCRSSFIQMQIKENIKAPRYWPLYGEFTGGRWIPRTNGQLRGKCFHLMTSSCCICLFWGTAVHHMGTATECTSTHNQISMNVFTHHTTNNRKCFDTNNWKSV